MTQKASQIETLTPLRGIAALWVVLFHFNNAALRWAGFPKLVKDDQTRLVTHGYILVDFFFVLSGFVITHAYADKICSGEGSATKKYLAARFRRIYPLHLFAMLACALLALLVRALSPAYYLETWAQFLKASDFFVYLGLGQSMGVLNFPTWNIPSWSISAEWWTYLAAIFLIPLLHRGLTWRVPVAWVVCFGGLVALVRFGGNGTLDYTLDFGTLRCLLDFVVGIGCYQLYRSPQWQRMLRRDGMLYLAVVLTLALLHCDSRDVLIIPSFSLLIVTAASNQGAPKRALGWRPLRHLGEVSYSVYLLQVIPLCIWKIWVDLDWKPRHPGVAPGLALTLLWLMVILGALVGLATLTHRYVELAGQRSLGGLGEKKALMPVAEASRAQ